jgi:excisionase family DNA binding protein
MGEELLSVAEAAERLGVHRTRVNQLIASGDLPAQRVGRAYAVRAADLTLVKGRPSPGRPRKSASPSIDGRTAAAKPAKKMLAKKRAKREK